MNINYLLTGHEEEAHHGEIQPDLLMSDRADSGIEEIRYRLGHLNNESISFGEFMRDVTKEDPDVFVLTANSAIPMADAVRGWYDMTGAEMPALTYIRANRQLAAADDRLSPAQVCILEADRARLHDLYAGGRAAVIDQFVDSGNTLAFAERSLERAGVKIVGSSRSARWYNHAYGRIDLKNMTSEHATFMRKAGREAVFYSSEDYLEHLDEWCS